MIRPFNLYSCAAAVACGCWFLAAPMYSFFITGPFRWHIQQPAAYEGLAEVFLLCGAFYAALLCTDRRLRYGLAGLAAALFTRRHGVDVSVILGYLYTEGLFTLGSTLLQRTGWHPLRRNAFWITAGLVGVVAWSLIIWIASAVGFGSIETLRLIAIGVLGIALVISPGPRLGLLLARAFYGKTAMERLWVAILSAFFLALFAKASVVIDFDSLWYGLQAEEVLVGQGSLFKPQGLVAVVHYYPKLFEALQLPFSGVGSVSLVYGVSIYSWLALVLTAAAILREYHVSRELRLCGIAVVGTLPALANISVSAKGDAFAAWLLLTALLAIVQIQKGRGYEWMWIAFSALTLALQTRLSVLPYAVTVFAILGVSIAMTPAPLVGTRRFFNGGLWIGAATICLTGFVTARTVLTSGMLLMAPHSLVAIQQTLGLRLLYPAACIAEGAGTRLPLWDGLWGILFQPTRFPHLTIGWTGNAWFYLAAVSGLCGLGEAQSRARLRRFAWPLLVLGATFFVLMFGYRFLRPGGDGNYFIAPLSAIALWAICQLDRLSERTRSFLQMLMVPFVLSGLVISFVTGSWGPGTRAFDTTLTRLPFELRARADQGLRHAHMDGVREFFAGKSPGTRVIGIEGIGMGTQLTPGWWLPVQYEAVEQYVWYRPEIIASAASFQQYVVNDNIEYVVVPTEPREPYSTVVNSALAGMESSGLCSLAFEDTHYRVWNLASTDEGVVTFTNGGTAQLSFDQQKACDTPDSRFPVTVSWDGSGETPVGSVAIELRAPDANDASLWYEGAVTGTATTGPWMSDGCEVIFRDGRAGAILGRATVRVDCGR